MLPAVAVLGTGAAATPVPPVAFVYQSRLLPVAVQAVAVAFWQYVMGDVTVGAGVLVVILTVIVARGPSHPFTV